MKKSIFLIACILISYNVNAQCTGAYNVANGITAAAAPSCTDQSVGSRSPYSAITFNVVANNSYQVKTDNVNWHEQLSLFNNGTQAYIGGSNDANGTSYTWVSGFTGTVRAVITRHDCNTTGSYGWFSGMQSATLTYRQNPSSIDPSTFGSNVWNTFVYNGTDVNLGIGTSFYGNYTESSISYDSRDRWGANNAPSDASGYQGCPVGVDNHTVVSKRQGFPDGTYYIDVNNHDDDAVLYINGSNVFSHAGCCDFHCNVWTGTLNSSSTVEFRHQEGGGGSHQGLNIKPYLTFGDNEWNIFAFNGRNRDNLAAITYAGYYTRSNLGFDTFSDYASASNPSTATGYEGCSVSDDNHTVVAKREGFPCGVYTLAVNGHDDEAILYVNGSSVWSATCCSDNGIKWTGVLDATSTVEMRYAEGGGGAGMRLDVTDITVGLNAGTISYAGSNPACSGYDPPAFTSVGASGGASGVYNEGSSSYQWQLNGTDIGGATSETYDPGALTSGAYQYQRVVTDACGNTATSNAITITIDVTPPTAICQNISVDLDATGNASITAGMIDNGSNDACGIASLSVSPSSFTCANVGANSVTLTVIDNSGNSSTCTATVTVNQASSTAATDITATSNVICLGGSTTLSVVGGSLGTGATWEWYSTSCGGTPVGSGPSIVVSPTAPTTYYVRAESVCGDVFTACAGPELVVVNATTTPPASATLPTAPGTYSSTCTINDALTHYMYDSNGNLLGAINSNGENLGDVTLTIEVGNNGPYGTGFPPGVCGYTGVTDGEYALARNWDIQITGSNPPANPSTVTFYYLSSEVTDLSSTIAGLPYSADYVQCWGNVTTESDLMMTVQHTGGSTELFTSITPAAGPGAGLRELGFNLGEFSQGFLHSNGGITGANNALPVELLSWEAKAVDNSYVHLSWSTATEINNAGFELLRSTDGENFEAIAWVEGNNNSTEIQEYSYNDNKVNVGTYYYQLKQVDHNGDYEYFDVLSATIKGTEGTLVGDVYPNPTDRDITISISSATDASINVQVFNYVGQEVLTQNAQIRTGNNQLKVNTNTLPEGAYYAVFQIGDELFTKKFVIIK